MELCKWYRDNDDCVYFECRITDTSSSCEGDVGRCECKRLRQAELHAEAIDLRADADRESGKL